MESKEVIKQLIDKYGYDFTDERNGEIDGWIRDLIVDTIAIVKNNVALADVSQYYNEGDLRHVFECFDRHDSFEKQIEEYNSPI